MVSNSPKFVANINDKCKTICDTYFLVILKLNDIDIQILTQNLHCVKQKLDPIYFNFWFADQSLNLTCICAEYAYKRA